MASSIFSKIVTALATLSAISTIGCLAKTVETPTVTSTAASSVEIVSKSNVALVLIPSGDFPMGSDKGRPDESPVHSVHIAAIAIDKYEVTQSQFAALEMPDPSQFKTADRPVEQIRWINAAEFCNARSRAEGLEPCYDEVEFKCNFDANGYRLPTEAEWEYAARAGSREDATLAAAAGSKVGSYACYSGNANQKTEPVGKKQPNAWGMHDMLGNVSEWCQDVYDANYYQSSPVENPWAGGEGEKRVIRGGSWKSIAGDLRPTARLGRTAGFSDACFTGNTLGFRCVRKLTNDEMEQLEAANQTDK
ncbi:MAG: sulfatase activating formylglycine-generating enzyme [Pirellulaceae bacterium]|jgi:formylglycine-generating enzyme required for sulfatase activity